MKMFWSRIQFIWKLCAKWYRQNSNKENMLQTLANQLHCNVSSYTPALQNMFDTTLPYENICVCCVINQKKYFNRNHSGSESRLDNFVVDWNANYFVHEDLLFIYFKEECLLRKKVKSAKRLSPLHFCKFVLYV